MSSKATKQDYSLLISEFSSKEVVKILKLKGEFLPEHSKYLTLDRIQ